MSTGVLLEKGLAALAITLPENMIALLQRYLALLEKWNRVHNLTAIRNPEEQVRLHILDCLAIVPLLEAQELRIADIGSGAGLPGLLWAMARPEWALFLVESHGKKSAFLREAVRQLALENVEVIAKRAEDWQVEEKMDWIVSRAMADIDGFLQVSAHLGHQHSTWGLMKAHDDEHCSIDGFQKVRVQNVEVPLLAAPRLWVCVKRESAYGN